MCGTTPRIGVRRWCCRARELAVDAAASLSERAALAAVTSGATAGAEPALDGRLPALTETDEWTASTAAV